MSTATEASIDLASIGDTAKIESLRPTSGDLPYVTGMAVVISGRPPGCQSSHSAGARRSYRVGTGAHYGRMRAPGQSHSANGGMINAVIEFSGPLDHERLWGCPARRQPRCYQCPLTT